MKFTGLELFMNKLEQMIHGKYNPLINHHPSFLAEMPQLQELYEQLDSMIHNFRLIVEHPQVTDLTKRFKDAALDAHDLVDLFVYRISCTDTVSQNQISASNPKRTKVLMVCLANTLRGVLRGTNVYRQQSWLGWKLFSYQKFRKISLNLDDVMGSIKSIKEELLMIRDNVKMDSSLRIDSTRTPSAAIASSSNRHPLGTKKVLEDMVVGLDRHVERIRDKLVEDQKQLDVVSIVGMGGLSKTTLATKVFNYPFVKYHFHVRGWVTVSQTYKKQELLIQILESIGDKIENVGHSNYSQLREKLHKRLIGDRYLIVIEDIWSNEAWDALKLFFPNNHAQSRILITSRYNEVALHAKPHGLIHRLEYLTEEDSWELLCKKVFHDISACPKWMIEPGMRIAKNCHGLPLTLVVIAGVLAKEPLRKDSWERIGRSVTSYIVSNEKRSIETLAWSLDHLSSHLRDCYLYLGGFPEDHKFQVQRLIWLWTAEGFVQEDGIRSSEEIAEDHVIELVDRNLVIVADRKSCGGIKSFYVHDLLRELCFKIATKENFYHKARSVETYKQRRLFVEDNVNIVNAPRIRSLLCSYTIFVKTELISELSYSWILLMVLDLQGCRLDTFPEQMSRLVHLRYLAISYDNDKEFLASIYKLWSLQTLIIKIRSFCTMEFPKDIANLVNLRHLVCAGGFRILLPIIEKPMYLQTISNVKFKDIVGSWVKWFPCVKKLSCYIFKEEECNLESLPSLERLKLLGSWHIRRKIKLIGFPLLLKAITLQDFYLPWNVMPIIQTLPNLEVLKLIRDDFDGPQWDILVRSSFVS